MSNSIFDFNLLWSAFSGLLSLVSFAICVYYVIAKPGADSILLVIGSFITFLTMLFYNILMPIITSTQGMDYVNNSWMYTIAGLVGLIGHICFTAGLIILIINQVNNLKKIKNLNQV